MDWRFPQAIKELDLTVMHYFIFEKCLGILGNEQRDNRNISFERNFTKCISDVSSGQAQCAIITKDISIETVKEVWLQRIYFTTKINILLSKSHLWFSFWLYKGK